VSTTHYDERRDETVVMFSPKEMRGFIQRERELYYWRRFSGADKRCCGEAPA
jgi:hypothetical protein